VKSLKSNELISLYKFHSDLNQQTTPHFCISIIAWLDLTYISNGTPFFTLEPKLSQYLAKLIGPPKDDLKIILKLYHQLNIDHDSIVF